VRKNMPEEKKEPSHKSQHYILSGVEFDKGSSVFFPKKERRMDHLIEGEIKEILLQLKDIEIKNRKLEVKDGVVRLFGEIDKFHDLKRVHTAIMEVEGVLEFIDQLQVK